MPEELTGFPSIDKPWLKYYGEEAINTKSPECSIYQHIYDKNSKYLMHTALIFFGKRITYKQLFANVDKTAKALVAYGVKYGDNVAICMPATPEAIYIILALNKIGANANMLNPTFSEQQLAERIKETKAELMFVVNELYKRVQNVIPNTYIKKVVTCSAVNSLGPVVRRIKSVRNISDTVPWSKFIKSGKKEIICVPGYEPDHPAIMVYSSGTTGASKGIQLTNDSVNALLIQGGYIGFDWKREDRFFCQIPIWFSTGICATVFLPLVTGITVILEPLYDFELFYKHIVKYKPNFMITAVGLVDYLKERKEFSKAYSNFKYLVIGGEYVVPTAEKKFNQWLEQNKAPEKLHKGYGMCECGSIITASHYICNVIGSAGVPLPHVTVAAFDMESGKELKYGERGEIRVLTPCKMSGYYNNEEATRKYFHEDEEGRIWACTGDMGYVTEDGSLFVDGRISSSYVDEKGNKIYLFDIERAVLNVEQVRQCKVVVSQIDGRPIHVVHMVLDKGADAASTLERVKKYCLNELAPEYISTWVKLYDFALPVAPSGKLDVSVMEEDIKDLIRL